MLLAGVRLEFTTGGFKLDTDKNVPGANVREKYHKGFSIPPGLLGDGSFEPLSERIGIHFHFAMTLNIEKDSSLRETA